MDISFPTKHQKWSQWIATCTRCDCFNQMHPIIDPTYICKTIIYIAYYYIKFYLSSIAHGNSWIKQHSSIRSNLVVLKNVNVRLSISIFKLDLVLYSPVVITIPPKKFFHEFLSQRTDQDGRSCAPDLTDPQCKSSSCMAWYRMAVDWGRWKT